MKKQIALSALLLSLGLSTTFTYGAQVNLEKNIAQINSSIEKANYRGADEVVYKTLTEYKNNYEVQALAAVSWALQSKLELAQDQIDRLKNIIPKNSDLHFAQGVVFYKRMASSNMEFRTKTDSLTDIATREFRYAIQLNPNNYKAYNALGVMDLRAGDLESARANIGKALQLAPNYAVAIDNLGTVYLAEGNAQKAEQYFKKAVSVNPNSSAAYYHLAQLEYANGNYAKCLTYINKCLAWKGYSSYAYNLRGDAYKQQGNEAAAIAAYKKAIEITPENLAPYANLASIYETRKDYELALDSYKTILSINPASEQTQLKVADIYLETGKYNEAINHYEKVGQNLRAEAIKGLSSAYYAVAMNAVSKSAFTSDKKLVEASEYLDKAIKENPNDLELYLAKAKLSALLNSPKESCDSLNQVLSKPCRGIDDYLLKGDANIALANFKDGFDNYKSAIQLAKTNDEKLYLGELFMFSKLYDEAEVVFNDLLKVDPSNVVAKNNLSYIKQVRVSALQQTDNANYFRKRNNMFFEREYLNKALKLAPYDVRANILMGRLNQRQRKYNDALVNYSVVVNKTNEADTLVQYTKRLNKVKSKIDRKIEREKSRIVRSEERANAKVVSEQEKTKAQLEREKQKAAQAKEKAYQNALKEKDAAVKAQQKEQAKLAKEKEKALKAKEKEQAKLAKEREKALKAQEKEKAKNEVLVNTVKKEKTEKIKQEKVKKEKQVKEKKLKEPDINAVNVGDDKKVKKSKKKNTNKKITPAVDYSPKEM